MGSTDDDNEIRRMFDIRSNVLDEQGNRVFDIELHAVRTHPADIRKALKTKGEFHLFYEVTCGHHKKTGAIELDDPSFRVVFQKGVDPDGFWEVRIEGVSIDGRWQRELWRQFIFVQKELRLSHEKIDELARRYAPVFIFSGTERYFPVSLQALLASKAIRDCPDMMKLKTVAGQLPVPLRRLGDFMRFNGHCDYLLDFNMLSMRRSVFTSIGGDPRDATIYYSYLEDPDSDRFFINYHLIYAFDTKAGLAKLTGIGPHVFDRESMVMVFEAGKPKSMIISGHLENQTIFLLEKLKIWSQGRIRVNFDDPQSLKVGSHPVVAVADGSHALYPTSGVYHLSLLREIAGYLDPEIMAEGAKQPAETRQLRPDQVLAPASASASARTIPSYDLQSMGLDRLSSRIDEDADGYDGHNAYLTFSGFWVDVPGTRNARFPPFTRKVMEIVDWVDHAYEWQWDDLPDRYHQNNRLILDFLRENLEDF